MQQYSHYTQYRKPQRKSKPNHFIIRMLKNCYIKRMAQVFLVIQTYNQDKKNKCNKIANIYQRNLDIQKLLSWKKLISNCVYQKNSQRKLKNIFNFVHRLSINAKTKAFAKIYKYTKKQQISQYKGLINVREKYFASRLDKFHLKKLRNYFQRIKKHKNSNYIQNLFGTTIIKFAYQKSFHMIFLAAFVISSQNQNNNYQKNKQIELKEQVNNMTMQLQDKNQNIQKLTNQLKEIRQIYENNNKLRNQQSILYEKQRSFQRHQYGLIKSNSKRSIRGHSVESKMNNSNFSSFFGNLSFGSSKLGQRSIRQQSLNENCNCIFEHKYKQYRSLHNTLKNQLEILKKQLDVAKDLNEHFENQLRIFGGRPQEEDQLEKLMLNLNDINKQRQNLKDKALKYQKNISNLKTQFKRKMENIYRKVKKQS